jgi:hypothetical protein
MAAVLIPGFRAHPWLQVLCASALSATLAGCVQSSGTDARKAKPAPEVSAVATGGPVVLSGVAYTEGNLSTPPGPNAPAAPPATSSDIVPPGTPPEPVVASTPVPPPAPALITAPTVPPDPEAPPPAVLPPVGATTADGFPNINVPPRQPEGQLLTPEERAKLIAELNALAGRKPGAQ